jgi:hypothetical protein
MPRLRYGLAAAAAACLLGGVAVADTPPAPTDNAAPPPAASPDQTAAPDQTAPPEQAAPAPPASASDQGASMQNAPAASATGTESSAQVAEGGPQVIAGQPVPDTPDNRAKYGQPLSHAGKHTAPSGN